MSTLKALVNFSRFPDSDMDTECKSILKDMTGNANFVTPIPTLAVIESLINSYSTALVASKSRDKLMVAEKKQARLNLEAGMTQLGNYVNTVSNGDLTMLTSSGFLLSKVPEPRIITAPENVIIEQGINPGVLIVKSPSVKGAAGYLHYIAPDPLTKDTVWDSIPSTRSQQSFENLVQGKKYWFKIAALGSNSQIAYSEEVSQYVMQKTAA